MIAFPPCKINIGLHITEKRSDGFHNIESVFVPVPLCDVLEILPADKVTDIHQYRFINHLSFNCSGITLPQGDSTNICEKAFSLLHHIFNLPPTVIWLHKNIPTGAGLGGGSSDGAYTLRMLNALYQLNLSHAQLSNFAASLGSDCPFFIDDTPKYITGRGEIMTPIESSLTGTHITIIKPNVHIATANAYALITPAAGLVDLRRLFQLPMTEWKQSVTNHFESPIVPKYPQISRLKKMCYDAGATYSAMSGSGSSVYALSTSALNVAEAMQENFVWQGVL